MGLQQVWSPGKLDEGFVTLFHAADDWEEQAAKWAEKYGAKLGKYYRQTVKDGCLIVCYVIKDKENVEPAET